MHLAMEKLFTLRAYSLSPYTSSLIRPNSLRKHSHYISVTNTYDKDNSLPLETGACLSFAGVTHLHVEGHGFRVQDRSYTALALDRIGIAINGRVTNFRVY